jgi:FkbM family methyltransferase
MSQVVKGDELYALDRFAACHRADPIVLDVGANVGDYTAEVVRRVDAAVYAYEPQRAARQALVERFAGNPAIRVLPFGLSDEEGSAYLRCSGHEACVLATLSDRPDAASYHGTAVSLNRRELIELRRLDDVAPAGPIAWMKVDVEGHELHVLRGAERTLRRTAIVQFEYNDCARYAGVSFHDLHGFLSKRGFRLYREHEDALARVVVPGAEEWVTGDSTRNYLAVAASWFVP